MTLYLIKSTLCLVLLYGVYRFFLEQEKMHGFNRFFLLFSLVFSFIVPLFSINLGLQAIPDYSLTKQLEYPAELTSGPTVSEATNLTSSPEGFYLIFAVVTYLVGALVMSIRFTRSLHSIISTIRNNPKVKFEDTHVVLLEDGTTPYSFLKYIFLDRAAYQAERIDRTVFDHELTHVRQYHTLDVLLLELVLIAFWFNPVLYLYKKSIQLNHEFIADEAVLSKSSDIPSYQRLLLRMSSGEQSLQIASSITFSTTKKRLLMMTQKPNRFRMMIKKVILFPAVASLFFLSTTYQAHGQDVQSLSLTELINAAYAKIESTNSLTDSEQNELNGLIEKIQKKLAEANAESQKESSSQQLSQQQESELDEIFERFQRKLKPMPILFLTVPI